MTTPPDAETPQGSSRRPRTRSRGVTPKVWIAAALIGVFALLALYVGVGLYTDRPEYCGTCHEMRPYVEAWRVGKHSSTWCVDCHVSKNYFARLGHKFSALGEVSGHFTGKGYFPQPLPANVPDKNCIRCHVAVTLDQGGFDHAAHASKAPCQACHAYTGHAVTPAALKAVGAFAPDVVRVPLGSSIATVDGGTANVAGHVAIGCTRCHNLKKTGCPACHKPKHAQRGDCQICHAAGAKWVFTHPKQADCLGCHKLPAKHFAVQSGLLPPCTACHDQPGKAWTFKHPAGRPDCSLCHAVPSKHFQPASGTLKPCALCHRRPGVAWTFAHPTASADCASCHAPPAKHSAGQCSQCHHKTGVSFAFSHPSTRAPHGISGKPCVACHPNGYTTSKCTCHG